MLFIFAELLEMRPWRGWELTLTKLGMSPSQLQRLGCCQFWLHQRQWLNGSVSDTCHKVLNVCSFHGDGWVSQPGKRWHFVWGWGWGGGVLVVAPSCCLHQLSVPLFSEHITTPTNKPCHLETPALVTMLSSSTTGVTHRHTHCTVHTHTLSTIFPSHCVPLRHWNTHLDRHVHKAQTHTTCDPQSNPHSRCTPNHCTGLSVTFPCVPHIAERCSGYTCFLSHPKLRLSFAGLIWMAYLGGRLTHGN